MHLPTTNYKLQTPARSRAGYTMIELLLVIATIAVLSTVSLVSLMGSRNKSELDETSKRIAALIREAQSRSVSQASSTNWGVHFENGTSPFYVLYAGSYSTSSRESFYALPTTLDFATSTVPVNGSINIFFSQLSGNSAGSSTISIYSLRNPSSSSTITVATSGRVAY